MASALPKLRPVTCHSADDSATGLEGAAGPPPARLSRGATGLSLSLRERAAGGLSARLGLERGSRKLSLSLPGPRV